MLNLLNDALYVCYTQCIFKSFKYICQMNKRMTTYTQIAFFLFQDILIRRFLILKNLPQIRSNFFFSDNLQQFSFIRN